MTAPKQQHVIPLVILVLGILLPYIVSYSVYQDQKWSAILFAQFFNIIPTLFLIMIWYGLKSINMPWFEWVTLLLTIFAFGYMGYQYYHLQFYINTDAQAPIALMIIPFYAAGMLCVGMILILILFLIYAITNKIRSYLNKK